MTVMKLATKKEAIVMEKMMKIEISYKEKKKSGDEDCWTNREFDRNYYSYISIY